MKKEFILIACLISFLLVACTGNHTDANIQEPNDIKELVDDYSGNQQTKQTASITSTELIVNDQNEQELTYDLPEEEFFVSIAPFVNETHPCEIHSLTGCQGELSDQDFEIYIEDTDGNTVLEETMNSGANGFIDLWLPRNKTFNVHILQDGKQVESEVSTFEDDGTCITTMQLL